MGQNTMRIQNLHREEPKELPQREKDRFWESFSVKFTLHRGRLQLVKLFYIFPFLRKGTQNNFFILFHFCPFFFRYPFSFACWGPLNTLLLFEWDYILVNFVTLLILLLIFYYYTSELYSIGLLIDWSFLHDPTPNLSA